DYITKMLPQLRSDDILGGSFCSTDGFVDPYSVMTGFITKAVDQGTTLWKNCEVTGISTDEHRIAGVKTTKGDVATRTVVNAAGAWAAQVAKFVGVELPVEPLRRMLVPSEPFNDFPHSSPMIIDMTNGFHFRPEGRGFLLAWNDPEETPGFKTDFENSFIEKILTRGPAAVCPQIKIPPLNPNRGGAALKKTPPPLPARPGRGEDVPVFFRPPGSSGPGVIPPPATGKILSDLILTGKTNVVSDASVL